MEFLTDAYELVKEEFLEDHDSTGYLIRHKKSGASIVYIKNEDDNKVFSIGFRTPPHNSTGVPHIIEHTVLCGSKEFPAKDPFIELTKGSLNTFLNAMTYPDKTIYPIASCNDKDFANLMHVYMDAVFYPNIYNKKEIFLQEGWHYELEEEDGEIEYNGVVYNEMKGAFSSPEQVMYRNIQQIMLKDTPYGVESGGDPENIPDLTYEEFLAFHKKYYHASNSYIYLYGDMDIKERLQWMDEHYLGAFDKEEVDSSIAMQPDFDAPVEETREYPISKDDAEEQKTYLSYNVIAGTSLDEKLSLAFQILDYVLITAPGAPLKQAFLDAEIGRDVLSSYDSSLQQPVYSIIAKDADEAQKNDFEALLKKTLEDICEKGLDARSLEGAINFFEFQYREADYGPYPKGLMYGLRIYDSWIYDNEKPFIHLHAGEIFDFMRKAISTGYFEDIIRTYLLENKNRALIIVKPSKGLTDRAEEAVKEKLAKYKASLSKEEIKELIEATKALHEYEMTPSTKEENEKIPMLSREDIDKKIRPLYNEEKKIADIPVIHHNIHTSKIAYLRLSFDITKYKEAAPVLSLLSSMFGYVDTKNYSFLELSNEINIATGGISADLNVYNNIKELGKYRIFFEIKTKALYNQIPQALELIKEILLNSCLRDEKRLMEILMETRSRMEMKMVSRGHTTAVDRTLSYFSESAMFEELASGISFYRYVVDLMENFDKRKEALFDELENWMHTLFTKENLLVSVTADDEGYKKFEPSFSNWVEILPETKTDSFAHENYPLVIEKKNEGFKTSGQVQYVARCGSFRNCGVEYTGALRILKVILNYDYLWNNIRVKGGAYGCMCGFSVIGVGYFTSYRDPKLKETNEVYEGLYDFVRNFDVDERDMTKYVIGAISAMDTPLNPSAKGSRSFTAYLNGTTEERLQKERNQVLNAQPEDIRATAAIVKAIIDDGYLCVVGNENRIEENKDMFLNIENLLA